MQAKSRERLLHQKGRGQVLEIVVLQADLHELARCLHAHTHRCNEETFCTLSSVRARLPGFVNAQDRIVEQAVVVASQRRQAILANLALKRLQHGTRSLGAVGTRVPVQPPPALAEETRTWACCGQNDSRHPIAPGGHKQQRTEISFPLFLSAPLGYITVQPVCGRLLRRWLRAARTAASKTWRIPSRVLAEHSMWSIT